MSMLVLSGGILTTVQDTGRYGRQQYGVPVSGAMDQKALRTANVLVGNPQDEAGLEMTIMGPTLEMKVDCVVAVTGADMTPRLNGAPMPIYRAVAVKAGDVLQFGTVASGARAYLAVAGGFDVPLYMGSKSTYLRGVFGGYEGRKLQKDDILKLADPKPTLPNMALRALSAETYPTNEITLCAVLGPQDDCFTDRAIETFFSAAYVITNEADRMGARLEGEKLEHIGNGNIISDGIAFGSVQIPTNGQPILMLADRQCTGGYTKIATVVSTDLPRIAQARPGMKVRFKKITIEESQDRFAEEAKALCVLEEKFAQVMTGGSIRTFTVTVGGETYAVEVREIVVRESYRIGNLTM